jgi:hypothetical protein
VQSLIVLIVRFLPNMSRTNHSTVPSRITSVVPLNSLRLAVAHGRKGPMKSFSFGETDTDALVSITIR